MVLDMLVLPYSESGYIWCFDIAFTASAFILLGAAFRKSLLILAQQKMLWFSFTLTASTAVFTMGTLCRADSLGAADV